MNIKTAVILSAALALPAAAQNRASRQIGVEEAVQLALRSSPGLQAAFERRDAASSQANALGGRMLPTVRLDEEFQHYNGPFTIAFPLGPPGAPPAEFTARNQNTNTFVAGLGQPVLGLIHLGFDYAALRAAASAAGEGALVVQNAVREAVQNGYLRYFEARALIDIARASESQLAEQHQIAEARLKAGVITQADLLRLQVAEANAKQQEIQAQTSATVAYTALMLAMGLDPTDKTVELLEPTSLENAKLPSQSEAQAQQLASTMRHEVLGARLQADSAQRQAHSRLFQLLPEINAEAAYLNVQGQVFAEEQSYFVGVKATWNIWEWGSSWFAYRSAEHQARAARFNVDEQVRQVKQDASSKLAQATAAAEAVALAQATIASAEEAYRVTDALVKAGSATTTDLLDAQSALTQARLNLVRARYEQAIATVSYQTAIGQ